MPPSFAVQLRRIANKTQAKSLAIHRAAVAGVERVMSLPRQQGGNLPYLTGNLYNSRMVTVKARVTIVTDRAKFADPSSYIAATIANLQFKDTVYLGFRAPYAPIQELRCGFTRLAVQQWPSIVKEAVKNASGKAATDYD